MATFYVLPSRTALDQSLADFLGRLLPGLPLPADTWDVVIDRLRSAAAWPEDVFLVPQDDLPEGEPIAETLVAAFGAEAGDRVVEVGGRPATSRTWMLLLGSEVPVFAASH